VFLRVLPLRLYYFACFAALGVYSPFFPRWLVARGVDGLAMGAVVATMPAMGLVAPPLVGMVADALGLRGSLLRVACVGSFLAFAAIAVAGATGHAFAFAEIFALVLVFAAFRAPMLMMADVVAVERERDGGSAYGKTRLWGSIGFLCAAIGAGRWLDPASPVALPAAVAVTLLVATVAALSVPVRSSTPPLPLGDELRNLLATPGFVMFLAAGCAAELAISSSELCYSLYLSDLGASSGVIGLAWGLGIVVEIGVMIAAGPLLSRFRPPALIAAALVASALRCALLATLRQVPALVAVQLLHSLSVTLFWNSSLAHLAAQASRRSFATAQGLFSAATAAGSVIGMLTWGAAYRSLGGRATFATAAVVAAGAAALAFDWMRRAQRGPNQAPRPEART
jgi:PPP family 3-phenylpropionic acid transporter